jgi:hypothetical protein
VKPDRSSDIFSRHVTFTLFATPYRIAIFKNSASPSGVCLVAQLLNAPNERKAYL